MDELIVKRAVALADACELCASLFSFPTDARLADALLDGAAVSDMRGCLVDLGVEGKAEIGTTVEAVAQSHSDENNLFEHLRHEFTMLFLLPAGKCLVSPYEAVFKYREQGFEGVPSLFQSPLQQEVERLMKQAGVIPQKAITEPADSVWNELSYLAFLYGSFASAVYDENATVASKWRSHIAAFWTRHGATWLPCFMDQVKDACTMRESAEPYGAFAEFGAVALACIDGDVRSFAGE